jgi:hypothetical protein
VAQAGGTLHWSSSIGQGTVFQVQLPLASPPEQVGPDALTNPSPPRSATSPPRIQAL